MVISIIALLASLIVPTLSRAQEIARRTMCGSNARHLVDANMLYATANDQAFVLAAQDIFKDLGDGRGGRFRWHGVRDKAHQPFDPARGPLMPYMGSGGQLKVCPTFKAGSSGGNDFESGCGGYGYNAQYVGGRNDKYGYSKKAAAESARTCDVIRISETVMFTDAGIAQYGNGSGAITEYSFCEPPFWQMSSGPPSTGRPSPSIHFRHLGMANVAWVDSHVSNEKLKFSNESYGLTAEQVTQIGLGWFGPESNDWFDLK